MIYRGFTYRLKPTVEQHEAMLQFAGVCRLVWNTALDQRMNHWRQFQRSTGNNLNYVTQARELTAWRKESDFMRAVSQESQQRTLKDLDSAFQRFFKGRGGFPKFKKAGVNDSFSFMGRNVKVEKLNRKWGRVKVPKIGWLKFRMTRPIRGKITEATITRTIIGWQISIGCKTDEVIENNGQAVGIDRGVAVPLMLSDGTAYLMPDSIDELGQKARKAQRTVCRRKRGSARHRKALRRVARLRSKQARARKHWAHVTTTEIADRFGIVVVERLRTKNMTRSARGTVDKPGRNVSAKRGLNRAILSVGWHQIETMLAYKCATVVKVDPANTSRTCAACGHVDGHSRKSQARFVCTACGHRDNADRNAAINILRRNTAFMDVEGLHGLPVEASTSVKSEILALNGEEDVNALPL